MNGSKGRARTLAAIKRRQLREAAAAGVDITDRAAVREWHDRRLTDLARRVSERSTIKP